jgi:putative ABC transport system permease protein
MSNVLFDLRCAVRSLRKNSLGAIVIIALALGIGSNTAMFSVANAILLQPLPYRDPDRLVAVAETNSAQAAERVPASAPNFVAWKTQSRTLDLAAFRPWGFVLTGGGEPERLTGARVSADFFPLLGTTPLAGRTFTAQEDSFGAPHVVLVSEGLWRHRFAGDPRIVGQALVLNGARYDVIGVMPRDPDLIDADVWVPLAFEPFALQQRGTRALTVIGRLKEGVTRQQAHGEMHAIAGELARKFPDANSGWDVSVVSLTDSLVGNIRPTVIMIWAAVALVLIVACANTANLLLVRGAARRQEVAVCVALGAGRARILRRLLTESVVLACAGGLAGIPIAFAGLRLFVAMAPANLPRVEDVRIDFTVLAFTFLMSVLTGIVFGIVPALRSMQWQAAPALRETAASTFDGRGRSTFRNAALASQVALAVIVLIAAGLLVRSFGKLLAVDLGFQPAGVMTMTFSLSDPKYGDPQRRAMLFDQFLARVERLPGVDSAGLTSHLPLAGRRLNVDFALEGTPGRPADRTLWADCSSVSADFFRAMNIPLRSGRTFDARDASQTPPVIVINEEMARRLWPSGDAIGRRVMLGATSGADSRPREVVGVVANLRSGTLEDAPGFQLYIPSSQNPWPTMSLAARVTGEPTSSAGSIRAELLALDPNQPVYNVRTLDQVIGRALAQRRFQVLLLALFAAVGLVLATIGVYSVVAHAVKLRTNEIGLRLALGAQRRDVLLLLARSGFAWALVGVAFGTALALWVSRLLSGMLFGIAPTDLLTYVSVISFTACVVLVACALAGRQAARVDPLVALRYH